MHKLREDSTRGGSPRSRHESHLISSLPCTSAEAVPIVSGGDVRVVGNGDMGGLVPSVLMDGDRNVSLWANLWDGPTSSCVMEPMS